MRKPAKRELTNEMWEKIDPLLPDLEPGPKGGRPWADNREVFEGILWILRTGARWRDLPPEYPSPATCWRRLHKWEEEGIWRDAWQEYLGQLDADGLLDWEEVFIDASFSPAKKGVSRSVPLAKGRAQSGWWWQTVQGFQLALSSNRQALRKSLLRSGDLRQ